MQLIGGCPSGSRAQASRGRSIGTALLLLLALSPAWARSAAEDVSKDVVVVPGTLPAAGNATALPHDGGGGGGQVQLKLCDCERATGPPNGLSCDKEGWFVSSFERQGQWVAGGGYVPLSHAICCRPCLPKELPPDPSGRIPEGQAHPLAVISLGCHGSTDELGTRCEQNAGSFVAGFSEAVKVFTTPDTYYPVNTVQCCTPALLLENGDAWELERCGCGDSTDPDFPVSCGGANTHELLLGYPYFRLSPLGHVVPVGPAQCCRACLSGTVHPMDECGDLNSCSGHGVCNMRRCECFQGWTGADCSQVSRSGKGIPPWAIALIVVSSSALAGVLIVAAGYALQALGLAPRSPAASEDGDGDERQPLLIRIDADDAGSVGSADTTDCEDDVGVEEVERRVTRAIQRLERAASAVTEPAAAAAEQSPEAAAAAAAGGAGEAQEVQAVGAEAGGEEGEGAEVTTAAAAAPEAEAGWDAGEAEAEAAEGTGSSADQPAAAAAAPAPAPAQAAAPAEPATAEAEEELAPGSPPTPTATAAADAAPEEPEELQKAGATCGRLAEGPLSSVDCSVCMTRPVQVVVVPCGHVCMCRRCSRRLNRCPICRKDIARRQRLFV